MRILKTIVVLLAFPNFLLFAHSAAGQSLIDADVKLLFTEPELSAGDFKKPLKDAENEVDILFASGFFVYKKVISSQDKPSCIFSPSCSEYAVEAFNQKGVVSGWLTTFDRLSRCHGFVNHAHYHFDINQKLFYDPIE